MLELPELAVPKRPREPEPLVDFFLESEPERPMLGPVDEPREPGPEAVVSVDESAPVLRGVLLDDEPVPLPYVEPSAPDVEPAPLPVVEPAVRVAEGSAVSGRRQPACNLHAPGRHAGVRDSRHRRTPASTRQPANRA